MKREDVVRLRSILGLLDEARMLVQAREPGAAGCFQRKFASQAADFMRDRGPALLALAEAVMDAPESGVVLYERVAGSPDCYAMVNAPVELAGQRVRLLPWGGVEG